MFQERLLERIRNLDRKGDERDENPVSREVNSIIQHLQRMLNTRQGSAPIRDDYGIPDFTNIPGETLTETATEMQKIIRQVLLKYEPRITQLKVSFDPQKNEVLNLRFKIEGILLRDSRIPVTFETTVSSDGKVAIEQ